MADKPEQSPKKLEKTFSSDFFSSLAKSLATTLAVGILGFTLQNFFAQRAQISVASVGHSDARYSNLVIIDNYSFSALENIQISFETPSIRIESQSQDTPISVERASPTEQSIIVSKVLPLRRFTINFITPTPLDQSKINTIGGPYGASFVRSDRLTSPIYSELLAYVVFVYMPMALMLIFFSLRLRRSHDRLSEESRSMIASADDLRKELDVVRRSTNEKLALLKKTYLLRMSRLSKENDFWRSFLVSIMNETLRGSVNPQKILKIFLGRNGGLTERDLNELEEAELSRLMQAKDPAYKAEPG